MFISKKKYDEIIEIKNTQILKETLKSQKLELDNNSLKIELEQAKLTIEQFKKTFEQLQKNRKVSVSLIEKNSRSRKKIIDNLASENKLLLEEIISLTESNNKKDNLLQNARDEILKLSKLVKREKPTIEELKFEKCPKTDFKKLVGTRR